MLEDLARTGEPDPEGRRQSQVLIDGRRQLAAGASSAGPALLVCARGIYPDAQGLWVLCTTSSPMEM